ASSSTICAAKPPTSAAAKRPAPAAPDAASALASIQHATPAASSAPSAPTKAPRSVSPETHSAIASATSAHGTHADASALASGGATRAPSWLAPACGSVRIVIVRCRVLRFGLLLALRAFLLFPLLAERQQLWSHLGQEVDEAADQPEQGTGQRERGQ